MLMNSCHWVVQRWAHGGTSTCSQNRALRGTACSWSPTRESWAVDDSIHTPPSLYLNDSETFIQSLSWHALVFFLDRRVFYMLTSPLFFSHLPMTIKLPLLCTKSLFLLYWIKVLDNSDRQCITFQQHCRRHVLHICNSKERKTQHYM